MAADDLGQGAGGWKALVRARMLLLHLATVLAVAATAWLGLWQLHAWQYHRSDRAAQIADQPPVDLDGVMGSDDPFPADAVGKPVTVRGEWVPASRVYVDGRDSARSGDWVLASLAVCPAAGCTSATPAIPVVLGATSQVPARSPRPTGTTTVTGWLQPGEGEEVDTDPRDDVLPSVRIASLLQRSSRDLYSGYLILDTPAGARSDLAAVTPQSLPQPPAGVGLRNLLYAIQWWVFGVFALYLWSRWCRDEVAGPRDAGAEEPTVAGGSQKAPIASEV